MKLLKLGGFKHYQLINDTVSQTKRKIMVTRGPNRNTNQVIFRPNAKGYTNAD
jgi:hypothetical protein